MKRALFFGAAVAVAVICGLCLLLPGKPEPTCKGIKISRFIGTAKPLELETALAKVGPEAVPYLIAGLQKRDTPWTKFWSGVWGTLPAGVRQLYANWAPIPTYQIRYNAILGLGAFGPEARSALPSVIKAAEQETDPSVRFFFLEAVGAIGRDSPEAQDFFFLRELQSSNRIVRLEAAGAIYSCHLRLGAAVPLLMRDLTDRKERPYNESLALGVIGAGAKAAVPLIVAQMDDIAIQGHQGNALLLGLIGIGQGLKPAVPAMIRVLQGTNEMLRPAAVEALMVAGSDAVDALPPLAEAQQDANPVVRALAAAAIGRIKGTPEIAVAGLMEQLRNTNPGPDVQPWLVRHRLKGPYALTAMAFDHRSAAAWLLGDLGPQAQGAVPLLTEAMKAGDASLRPIAARAVYKITGQEKVVLPTLLNSLSTPYSVLALQALYEMGTNALPAAQAVRELMTRDLWHREVAREVLNQMDPAREKPANHRASSFHGPKTTNGADRSVPQPGPYRQSLSAGRA